ncbi:MAG: hypothetical protein HKN12_02870, partial [Gemmatimonadetes bacterium]|nr:hypothetical protein [Gemmatimonadota bacterium]
MTRTRILAPGILVLGTLTLLIAAMLGASPQHGNYLSPADIQQTENPSGDSPWTGQSVEVQGVVTGVSPLDDFYYIGDPRGGAWSGVKVSGPSLERQIGEVVFVVGVVAESSGETRVEQQSVTSRGMGRLPEPSEIGVADLVGNGEPWEGVLVRLRDIVVASGTDRFGEFAIHDATGYNGEVDDEFFYSYIADVSDTFISMTGLVGYGFGDFHLEPRSDADFRGYVSSRPNDASVVVSVTDGKGRFLPCRLTFFPPSGSIDLGPDDRASGTDDIAYVWKDRQTVPVPAGTYDVVVSRGLEYGIHEQRISVGTGGEVFLNAVLTREVDTRGWISGDFHLHSSPSSDTGLPVAGRLQSL